MFCGDSTLVKHECNRRTVMPLACRSWGCPECSEKRKAQLVMMAKNGKPNTFITLTVNPAHFASPQARARQLAASWRIIVKRLKRLHKIKRLPYLAVFERTKKGEPHLHLLVRSKWIDQKWLSAQMDEQMGAPIVDIRRVQSLKKAARYVAKYIGKDPHRFATCKRYWRTQDWERWRADKEEEDEGEPYAWSVLMQSMRLVIEDLQRDGWHIVKEGREVVLSTLPP